MTAPSRCSGGSLRAGQGGKIAGGRQYVSWIHWLDFARAVLWLLEHETLAGAVNLAAPGPLPQAEFARHLRAAAGRQLGLPTPRWLLEIGAVLLRTDSDLVLKSRRVVPRRLSDDGFVFEFTTWEGAARDLASRSAGAQGGEAWPAQEKP